MLERTKAVIKRSCEIIDKILDRIFWTTLKLILAVMLDLTIIGAFIGGYWYYFTPEGKVYQVNKIYHTLLAQTGQTQEALPLLIVNEPIDNAYNDGTHVVIYTGLLSHLTKDEIAMVLAHEIAHGMLWHLKMDLGRMTDYQVQVIEANADKMGALYMIKAGYDVCKGRELFKDWKEDQGDHLGGNHPNYAYRLDELNINCD